jgi:hypothetical protein
VAGTNGKSRAPATSPVGYGQQRNSIVGSPTGVPVGAALRNSPNHRVGNVGNGNGVNTSPYSGRLLTPGAAASSATTTSAPITSNGVTSYHSMGASPVSAWQHQLRTTAATLPTPSTSSSTNYGTVILQAPTPVILEASSSK